jgi:hypothetical protein
MRTVSKLLPILFGLSLAACGSSSSGTAVQAASSQYSSALAYSTCMRAHGVANFPDPSSSGNLLLRAGPGTGIDPSSPTFQSAEQACHSKLPNGGTPQPLSESRKRSMLQFSECMRSHGLSNFPDPSFVAGGARLRIGPGLGIDPNSPAFKAAQKACQPLMQKLFSQGAGVGGR